MVKTCFLSLAFPLRPLPTPWSLKVAQAFFGSTPNHRPCYTKFNASRLNTSPISQLSSAPAGTTMALLGLSSRFGVSREED